MGAFVHSARDVVSTAVGAASRNGSGGASPAVDTTPITQSDNDNIKSSPPTSGNAFFSTLTSVSNNVNYVNFEPLQSFTKSLSTNITNNITGKNTIPDKTTASQVLMFRQLLHTKCRPGLRLSRGYEGTVAQRAVLHMPVSF